MISQVEWYLLWSEEGTSCMFGFSNHKEERTFELFLGIVAISIGY